VTTSLERDLRTLADRPWEPLTVEPRSGPPLAGVDPDRSKGWLQRVVPLLKARRGTWLFALGCAMLAMVTQVAVPRVTMAAIDTALDARREPIGTFVAMLAVLAVARGVLTFAYRRLLYGVAYDLEYDLRVGMYEHLTRMSFSFYDRVQSGQLISRANSDIRSIQMFLTFAPLMLLQVFSFVVAFGLMLAIHVPLAIVSLLPLPLVFVVGLKMRDLMFPISWIVQGRAAEIATVVEENVTGVRVVRAFAAEQAQIGVLARAARRLRWATQKQIDVRATYAPVMEGLPRIGMAAVLAYGGWLAIDGQVTVGAIVAFSTYVVLLQAPFRMLGFLMMMSQRAAASAQRIYEILDTAPDVAERPGAVDLVDLEDRIELDGVRFRYAADPDAPFVLDGLDLVVEPGETVAVVGRTGSGKSTLARLVPRFYDVTDGAVRVDGIDVRDLTLSSLRAAVGLVLDEPFLFSTSVRDNIGYGRPDADHADVEAAARAAQAHEFITELPEGYDTQVGERGYTLSGGQRQRIAIARALLLDPRILVLDDATSAIDVHVEEQIHTALTELLGRRTTLVIAHRLSTISLADRVVLLHQGRVAASGTHAELMATEPRYAEVLAHLEEDEEARQAAAAARAEARAQLEARMAKAREAGERMADVAGPMPGGR
jgi:ATP-binding cassette subfamily B protein